MADIKTREEWLATAVERLWPRLEKHGTIPATVHVICSWPSRSIRKVIGECYRPEWTEDGSVYITISPMLKDHSDVLHTLLHEMVHAVGAKGHGKKFKTICERVGLANEGNDSSMYPESLSPELVLEFGKIVDELGPYPHVQMKPPEKKKKETTGEQKRAFSKCVSPDTGYWVYVKTKLLEEMGPPICPKSNKAMEVVKDEDE